MIVMFCQSKSGSTRDAYVFDDSGLEVLPSLFSLVALESVRCRVARISDLEILFKVLDETAPVDDLVRLDELQQLAR